MRIFCESQKEIGMMPRSVIMYGGVSALCLALHNVVMIFGDQAGWLLIVTIMTSFCLVSFVGYLLHSMLTFHEPLRPMLLVRYTTAMSANIPLAFVTVTFWRDVVGFPMIWASPIATICMLAVNYLLSRWAIKSRAS